jgi:hypothetical protein
VLATRFNTHRRYSCANNAEQQVLGRTQTYPRQLPSLQAGNRTYTNYAISHPSCEPGSSGSTVSAYGLDNRAIEVPSSAETKDFSCSLCVQTGSGAHPASCTMGTGGPFPGGKARPGRDADHSHPSSAKVVNE